MLKLLAMHGKNFSTGKDGATAIEYGLIAALIAVVIIGGVAALGGNISAVFDFIGTELDGATEGQGAGGA
jgi:pilus assembly protein Flp/PilA